MVETVVEIVLFKKSASLIMFEVKLNHPRIVIFAI